MPLHQLWCYFCYVRLLLPCPVPTSASTPTLSSLSAPSASRRTPPQAGLPSASAGQTQNNAIVQVRWRVASSSQTCSSSSTWMNIWVSKIRKQIFERPFAAPTGRALYCYHFSAWERMNDEATSNFSKLMCIFDNYCPFAQFVVWRIYNDS